MDIKEEFIGDGLYVSMDGGMIMLRAPRPGGDHVVFMEDFVLVNFIAWLEEHRLLIASEASPPLPDIRGTSEQ